MLAEMPSELHHVVRFGCCRTPNVTEGASVWSKMIKAYGAGTKDQRKLRRRDRVGMLAPQVRFKALLRGICSVYTDNTLPFLAVTVELVIEPFAAAREEADVAVVEGAGIRLQVRKDMSPIGVSVSAWTDSHLPSVLTSSGRGF
jgi:hypothetical protein